MAIHDSMMRRIPGWLLILAGVVYATGFLATQFYHESYSIRALDTEVFKARYVYIGIVFVVFVLIVAVPAAAAYDYYADRKKAPWLRLTPVSVALGALLPLFFYVPLVFAPPGSLRDKVPVFCGVLIAVLLMVPLAAHARTDRNMLYTIRALYTVVVGIGFYFVTEDIRGVPTELFVMVVTFFVIFSACAGVVAAMIFRDDTEGAKRENGYQQGLGYIVLGLLYFLLVASFAGLFHRIPAGRGGGDLSKAGYVTCCISEASGPVPADLIAEQRDGAVVTKPLVLIEATEQAIYVADASVNGGPVAWRESWEARPSAYEIPRARVLSIKYDKPVHEHE